LGVETCYLEDRGCAIRALVRPHFGPPRPKDALIQLALDLVARSEGEREDEMPFAILKSDGFTLDEDWRPGWILLDEDTFEEVRSGDLMIGAGLVTWVCKDGGHTPIFDIDRPELQEKPFQTASPADVGHAVPSSVVLRWAKEMEESGVVNHIDGRTLRVDKPWKQGKSGLQYFIDGALHSWNQAAKRAKGHQKRPPFDKRSQGTDYRYPQRF
jgi:hypothetical protein